MPIGMNPVVANAFLDSLFSGAAWTPPAASYVQLHTGDPGVAGTASISSYTTRTVLAWASSVNGSKSITGLVTITSSWTGTSPETVTHVSYWDSLTGGLFVISDQLALPVRMTTGAPLTIPSLTAPLTPIAS